MTFGIGIVLLAGADIKEMKDKQCENSKIRARAKSSLPPFIVADVYKNKFLENWGQITHLRKPIIAAVSGYAVRS